MMVQNRIQMTVQRVSTLKIYIDIDGYAYIEVITDV